MKTSNNAGAVISAIPAIVNQKSSHAEKVFIILIR